jgi:hypothetical protein
MIICHQVRLGLEHANGRLDTPWLAVDDGIVERLVNAGLPRWKARKVGCVRRLIVCFDKCRSSLILSRIWMVDVLAL